ncbi:hypothetical protein [Arthrobacter sp. ISL-5]|uniref:hypothetical protein n=1 Tax=Arthrobacter sp. ISL-5 TaxID=2819111 RepID=UPI001BECDE4D|nr:hypothetical protein [Arthrobacter sp. ISL-5]MBT2553487.1 hypothetical protein [Arthrobacter sp. ISL-5]
MSHSSDDWNLLVGRTVELLRDGQHVRTAEVEDASWDSSVMWLRFDGNHGRQLIAKTDGFEVRPVS